MRRYELDINGKHYSIAVHSFSTKRAELEVDGSRYTVAVSDVVTEGEGVAPFRPAQATARPLPIGRSTLPVAGPASATAVAPGSAASVTAPIPGQILALLVQEGDVVTEGQPLLKMEAMKMENTIIAPADGTVGIVSVHVGDVVTQGQELLVIG